MPEPRLTKKSAAGAVIWMLMAVVGLGFHRSAGAGEAETLTFEQARAVLFDVSDTRKASEAAVSRSEDESRAARTLALPGVFANTTEVFGEKTGTIKNTPLGNINFSDNLRGPRASVNANWAIYSGGRITATQHALAAGIDAAQAEMRHTEEDLDLLLATEYFGLELATNIEQTRTSVLEQADRQLQRALRFEEQGLIPRVERLSAQVARDEAAREQVSAQRDREIAEVTLQRLLHRETPIRPATPLFISTRPLKPLEQWLNDAETHSPTLAALAAKRSEAEQGVVIEQARWKPQIFAFGSYNLIKKYQSLIEPDWIAGVGINFTLFSPEDRASKISSARATLRQVASLHNAAGTGIATEIEAAFRKVEQAREQFNLLESTLALAEESLRLRERGFAEGQSTSLDISEARNAVARSKTERALASYDYVVALMQLLRAAGESQDLAEYIQHADTYLPP